ncbi:MAG: hypothetical protein AAGA84_00070 [Pseudomonadota bacterium]
MSNQRTVIASKIASLAMHQELSRELKLSADIVCEEGVLVAVEVLNNKSRYNVLELTSGRQAVVKRGDIIVGALGHRKALFGYSGSLPAQLTPGDIVQMLNIGGVLGLCDSANPDLGDPFDCRVLGMVMSFPYLGERIGVPARAGAAALPDIQHLDTRGVPVVALAGTCMDSGKTAAACAIVSQLRARGLKVAACKSTGVSLRRDILAMQDAGAGDAALFSDFGIMTTTRDNGPALARALLDRLARPGTDVIVMELGDGLLGTYGVDAILEDEGVREALTSVVLCANDPVAAWGGVQLLADRYAITPTVVTGPSTDNAVGVNLIREQLHIPACNALTEGRALGDTVYDALEIKDD